MKPIPEWNKQVLLQSPLFAPLHPILADIGGDAFPTLQECNALLAAQHPPILTRSGLPVCFVPQEFGKLPFERQYEPRCYLNGEVPTRADNWHDLLNALMWLAFPKSKAAINARHYAALLERDAETEGASQRGAVRDVNTLLDESGVIVVYADEALAGLLRDFRWKELFWQRRAQVRAGMGFYLFGHGLYEKALRPYTGMTGQGLLLKVEAEFFGWPLAQRVAHLDGLLANHLDAPGQCRSTRDLSPVPLLGMPGWAVENDNPAYYDNTAYFRPGRRGQSNQSCAGAT
ncbi:MAG: DUF3025 domain-containing protein [Gallionella sp.]|nr:DUF3025 domain-containing protein [Gallionella sp.]